MPLFRRHRGGLIESLETTVIIKNIDDLKEKIRDNWAEFLDHPDVKSNFHDFNVKIYIPYHKSIEESFDKRCGWYTHYVTADILKKGSFGLEGFLSEPLNDT